MNINNPRCHTSRNDSSDSLVAVDLSRPRRGNSSNLSLYGESSRDLLDFSRYLDENRVEKDSSSKSPRRSKLSEESSFTYPIGSDSLPKALSARSSFHADASSPISPSNNDHLKTPPFIEMTNTRPFGDFLDSSDLDKRCSSRRVNSLHTSDYCCDTSLKSHPSLSERLQKSPVLKKAPPAIGLQKSPIRTATESVVHRSSSTLPSPGSVRRTKSSDDNSSSSSSHRSASPRWCSTHSLQWDRIMVQVMPGYSLPLAGTHESIAAYRRQAVQETVCQACQTELFCIDTASMVLCPMCRTFSPTCTTTSVNDYEQLGLGLTAELLAEEFSKL